MNLEARHDAALRAAGLVAFNNRKPQPWLLDAITTLSHGLTRQRRLAGRPYLDDQALRAAYVAMYWPVSYLHARSILGRLAPLGTVLDIGGGTGASAAAALDAGAESVVIVDHAPEAMAYCRRLFVGEAVTATVSDAEAFAPSTQFDTILAVHVLNELFAGPDRIASLSAMVRGWMEKLAPGGRLVIIEPALKQTSADLLKVRDNLIEHGHFINAPCFFQGPCPALADDDWCHTSFSWTPPPWLGRLSEQVNLDRTRVKLSYLVVSKQGTVTEPSEAFDLARIVSEPLHTKGRLRYIVCGLRGRYPIVMPKTRLTADNAAMRRLPPGSVIELGEPRPKGDGQDVSETFVRIRTTS